MSVQSNELKRVKREVKRLKKVFPSVEPLEEPEFIEEVELIHIINNGRNATLIN